MDEQIKLLLSHGKKVHAVKLLRSEKGLSIADAMSYIKRLEREMKRKSTQRKITKPSAGIERQVRIFLRSGQEGKAIDLLLKKKVMKRREARAYIKSLKLVLAVEKESQGSSHSFSSSSRSSAKSNMSNIQDKEKLERDTRKILQEKGKVEAIKFLRTNLNVGLREGKELVDGLEAGRSFDGQRMTDSILSSTLPTQLEELEEQDKEKLEREARKILREKGKIEAMKFIRKTLNLGLRECKELADGLEAGRSFDGQRMKDSIPSFAQPEELEEQVRKLLAKGKKIQAIRLVCETAGLGLRQGKEYVESL